MIYPSPRVWIRRYPIVKWVHGEAEWFECPKCGRLGMQEAREHGLEHVEYITEEKEKD